MRKLIHRSMALFIIALFVVSLVPLALAESGVSGDNTNFDEIKERHDLEEKQKENNPGRRGGVQLDDDGEEFDREYERKVPLHEICDFSLETVTCPKGAIKDRNMEHSLEKFKRFGCHEVDDNIVCSLSKELNENCKPGTASWSADCATPSGVAGSGEEGNDNSLRNENERLRKQLANSQAHILKLKEKLQEAHQNYVDARERFHENKERVAGLQDTLKGCKEKGEDCFDEIKEAKKGVKDHLDRSGKLVFASLEKLEQRVNNAAIPEDLKLILLEQISTQQENVEAAQETLDNLPDNATSEEIMEAKKELKETVGALKPMYKLIATLVLNNKLEHVINQMNVAADRIGDKANEAGVDVSAQLLELESELNAAFDVVTKAGELMDVDDLESGVGAQVEEAVELEKEARLHLKNSQGIMREIMKILRDNIHAGSNDLSGQEILDEEVTA